MTSRSRSRRRCSDRPTTTDLAREGVRIYNRWLAAVCSDAPDRHVGLAQLPIWDVDASVEELRWAHAAGLKGVNFPAPRPWVSRLRRPCAGAVLGRGRRDRDATLHTLGGGDAGADRARAGGARVDRGGGWFSRRAASPRVAGVFERHPDLELVLTEQPGSGRRGCATSSTRCTSR